MVRMLLAGVPALFMAISTAAGAIPIEGVQDFGRYDDEVAFRVPVEAGYDYSATLDGAAIAAGVSHTAGPDYHELSVTRTPAAGGDAESALVRFMVRATARASTEWGLPPWTPYPQVPSAAGEFAGSRLVLVTPAAFPAGLRVPVIALVEGTEDGHRVGVNGTVEFAEHPGSGIRLLRGVGSGFLPAAAMPGPLEATGTVGPLQRAKSTVIDAATSWLPTAGAIPASVDWGEDARIDITGDVTIAAGATVTIGAGSVVRIAKGADITVNGAVNVNGTRERPVTFTPASPDEPWGGFIFRADSRTVMTGAILTGAGEDQTWFDTYSGAGSSHKKQQAILWLGSNVRADLTDCWLIWGKGQAGHGEGAFPTLTRCLLQGFTTGGQYNGGGVVLDRTAVIEMPGADAPFADSDNDGIYLTGGSTVKHVLRDCLIGWTLDDGVDAGGGSISVEFTRCWFESTYHDAFAMSADGTRKITDCVVTNSGQGIECGFNSVKVTVDRSLSTANCIGARFGDSYDWDYTGFLTVTNSILIHNRRDVWAQTWDLDASDNKRWWKHLDQTDVRSNLLTVPNADHPSNSIWDPASDAALLAPFLPAAGGVVGIGIASRKAKLDLAEMAKGVPVRLSAFSTAPAGADLVVETEAGPAATVAILFAPGETVKLVPLPAEAIEGRQRVEVTLANPAGGEITGLPSVLYGGTVERKLVPSGSVWKYLDTNIDPGTAWKKETFDDSAWKSGAAELGHGDAPVTDIDIGPSNARYPTLLFRARFDLADPAAIDSLTVRIRRDDGAIVWLNETDVLRSNMDSGTVLFTDWAAGVADDDGATAVTGAIDPSILKAGTNTIAVEVHQSDGDSSDITFDLELLAVEEIDIPVEATFLRGDANGDGAVDIADAVRVLFALFAGRPAECDDALDTDDSGDLAVTDAIRIAGYLFLADAPPPPPFPEAGKDPTADGLGCAP